MDGWLQHRGLSGRCRSTRALGDSITHGDSAATGLQTLSIRFVRRDYPFYGAERLPVPNVDRSLTESNECAAARILFFSKSHYDSCRVAKAVLKTVAIRGEARNLTHKVLQLDWLDGDVACYRNVNAATGSGREAVLVPRGHCRIEAGRSRYSCSAEQCLNIGSNS